jgi:hypothetical protein
MVFAPVRGYFLLSGLSVVFAFPQPDTGANAPCDTHNEEMRKGELIYRFALAP